MRKKGIAMLMVLAMAISSLAVSATAEEADTEGAAADVDISDIPSVVTIQDTDVLQGKKIGNTICYKGDEWCAELAKAFETLADVYGVTMTVEDGDLNDETQTKQLENMVASECDMIFADPITPDGSGEAFNKAYDEGIPMIIYDGYWSEGEEKAVSTVTWDQYLTGQMVGEYFIDYVRDNMDGECTIVELTNAVSEHCQERFVGFHDVIDAADDCDITILNQYDSEGNRETAYNAIASVVEPYDCIISDVDNGAQGAVAALRAEGDMDTKVFCFGGYGEEPFTEIYDEDPNYVACLGVDAWVLAQFVFDDAIAYFEGEEVAPETLIDLYVVDKSNVEDFWTFD